MKNAGLINTLIYLFLILSLILAGCQAPTPQPSAPSPSLTPATQPVSPPSPTPKPTPTPEPASTPTTKALRVHFIDVGQGDSILIDHGETEILIDGGSKSPGVVTYLNDYIDGALEVMVATHPHSDHIGGLIGVLSAFEVLEIWLNGDKSSSETYQEFMSLVNAEGATIHEARLGDSIQVGSLTLLIRHPVNLLPKSPNNNSIVLLLSYDNIDFLFTGDAQVKAEESMLAKRHYPVPDVDILKVGYHGSRSSSSARFLDRIRPEVAIYMAGEGNQNHHPHAETIYALSQIGADIYGTDIHGNIIVTTNGDRYSLQLEKGTGPLAPITVLPIPSATPLPSPTPADEPPEFSLDVEIKPAGAGTVKFDPAGGVYPRDTMVHLTFKAEEGYEFVQWTVDNVAVPFPEVSVTMDSDKTAIIYFKRTNW